MTDILKIIGYLINNDDTNIDAEISSIGQWLEDMSIPNLCDDALQLLTDELQRKHLLFQTKRIDAVAKETFVAGSKIKQEVNEADRISIIQQCVVLCNIRYNGHIPDEAVADLRMIAELILGDGTIIKEIIEELTTPRPSTENLDEMYKILNLEPGADANEIKKAYRRIALTCHPDRLAGVTESECQWAIRMLQTATEAKEALLQHINENN